MRIIVATLSVTLLLCAGCGKQEPPQGRRQPVQRPTPQRSEAITPEMVANSELIVLGRFGVTTMTGSANSHIIVDEVLLGSLEKGKELVIVYRNPEIRPDTKLSYIFCLKLRDIKNGNPKYRWTQFLGPNLHGLVKATESNVVRIRELLVGK